MSFAAIANLVVFVLLAGVLFNFRKPPLTLGQQILLGLILGAGYGLALQFLFGSGDAVVKETLPLRVVQAYCRELRGRTLPALGSRCAAMFGCIIGAQVIGQ